VVTQLGFTLFIGFITLQHIIIGEDGATVTPSPEAFCPFGGLETLYRYVTSGGSFVPHTHLSNIVILMAVLVTAFLARSAFCGWVCPLGFIQDLLHRLSVFTQKRVPWLRKGVKLFKTRLAWLAVIDHPLRLLKYGVLVWAVTGAAIYGVMVFRDYDPWAALINIAEWSLTPGLIVLLVIFVASLFVERPWCRYACPLGAASGIVGKFSPIYLQRNEASCKVCSVCTGACPMGLPIHTSNVIASADCVGCLECIGACPRNGALELKVGAPALRGAKS
jgi:polyferredoxin